NTSKRGRRARRLDLRLASAYSPSRGAPPAKLPRSMPRRPPPPPYVELHAASAFSFLNGASLPEDLAQQAAAVDLPALALLDANGVYGAPRFHQVAKQAGIRALVGAEVVLEEVSPLPAGGAAKGVAKGPLGLVPEPAPETLKPAPAEADDRGA